MTRDSIADLTSIRNPSTGMILSVIDVKFTTIFNGLLLFHQHRPGGGSS
jgi:hypothetical protein